MASASASSSPSPYDRAEKFEKQLKGAFVRAFVAALLHKCTTWVGAATLTWATVVLMGGFAAALPISDFVDVTYLVLAIACLLGLALLTGKLVTKKSIYTGPLHPARLSYQDKRLRFIAIIQLISCLIQFFVFILPCLCIALPRIQRPDLKDIHILGLLIKFNPKSKADAGSSVVSGVQACLQSCAAAPGSNSTVGSIESCVQICFSPSISTIGNLQVCLYTFFLLVIVTCILASLCLMYIVVEASLWHKSLSLKKYHDEVLSRAMNSGLVEADEFDVREFLLRGLGEDLVIRNIPSLEVKRQNAKFIKYLYNHPKGVEMVYEGLAAEDTVRQQTAANMPGFWAREEKIENHTVLLCRLAEKLGLAGKTAEGAANSFSALAVAWKEKHPSPLLGVDVPSCDEGRSCINVVERVVDLVLGRRAPTLQVYMRVLDSFFMSASVANWLASKKDKHNKIKDKLRSIIQSTETGQNTNAGGETAARKEPTGSSQDTKPEETAARRETTKRSQITNAGETVASIEPATVETTESSQDTKPEETIARKKRTESSQNTNGGESVTIRMEPSVRPRTRFLAFSALDRLNTHTDTRDSQWPAEAKQLLKTLDIQLKVEKYMWYDEAERYEELCTEFHGTNHQLGAWLAPKGNCVIRGSEFVNME